MLKFLREVWMFSRAQRKFWLFPLLIIMAAFGGIFNSMFGGLVSGNFMNCVGSDAAFAGSLATQIPLSPVELHGTFSGCKAGSLSFGGGQFPAFATGAKFLYCNGGPNSFTTINSPLTLYCVKNNAAYP